MVGAYLGGYVLWLIAIDTMDLIDHGSAVAMLFEIDHIGIGCDLFDLDPLCSVLHHEILEPQWRRIEIGTVSMDFANLLFVHHVVGGAIWSLLCGHDYERGTKLRSRVHTGREPGHLPGSSDVHRLLETTSFPAEIFLRSV